MKTNVDQYCINVSDLEKSVHFYETVLGLEITHRVEIPNVSEVILSGEDGNRIQLAWHHDHEGPIDHGNAFWKLYIKEFRGLKAAAGICVLTVFVSLLEGMNIGLLVPLLENLASPDPGDGHWVSRGIENGFAAAGLSCSCLLYTSPRPRD